MHEQLGLIEPDRDMRSRILRELAGAGIHAEAFEDVAQFVLYRREGGCPVLAADDRVDALSIRRELARHGEWQAVIAFSREPSPARIVEFLRGGGYDYLAEPLDMGVLGRSLSLLDQGRTAYCVARCRAAAARLKLDGLSPREAEVLGHMAQGRSNKTIGIELGISPRTVEIHQANMLSKMGADCSTQALRMYYEDTLLNAEASAPTG